MPIARLQASFSKRAIETENGIIRDVKVMEFGAQATFKTKDGQPKSIKISDKHISALLSHAGNRAIPAHWSHDWMGKELDAIHDRVGALKNFRKDSSGSLIADLHLSPGTYRDKALWSAENEPENIMLSAVYGYSKFDADCVPSSFEACDIVADGAATYALFSKTNPEENDMTKEEIEALITQGVTAALKVYKPATPEGMLTEAQFDEKLKAALATHKSPISEEEKKSIALLAKAELTTEVGKIGLQKAFGGQGDETAVAKFSSAVKVLTDGGVKEGAALKAVMDKNPELYRAAQIERGIFKS